ncbi:hypothetical protein ACIA8R_18120 [Nonomuraea sp. NPDC051191]|uniref:hypothetical protein n=1 Tax=Nonomuraea sp. NPDC051191 TaxID=3364372 RepID=UPI0037985528
MNTGNDTEGVAGRVVPVDGGVADRDLAGPLLSGADTATVTALLGLHLSRRRW